MSDHAAVRVGVAGLGRLGIAHAALLGHVPGAVLVGLADAHPSARASARGMGLRVPAFRDVRRMLARAEPGAVMVCVPESQRPAVARTALEAGRAVLIEHPMAPTLDEARQLVQLAADRGLRLAVAHPLAFEPVFAEAVRFVASGALGKLSHASASMFLSRVFGPRGALQRHASGGVVAQVASDLLLVLVRMFGAPHDVTASWTRYYGPHEDELHGTLHVEHRGAPLAVSFDASWSVPGYLRAATVIELHGERGSLLVSDDALEYDLKEATGGRPSGYTRVREPGLPHPAAFDLGGESPWLQDAAFVAWVAGGEEPPNAARAALDAHRIVDALYRSARADGATVTPGAA